MVIIHESDSIHIEDWTVHLPYSMYREEAIKYALSRILDCISFGTIKAVYEEWLKDGIRLPYLEEWEQWRCISIDYPVIYQAILRYRDNMNISSNSIGLWASSG